MEDVHQVLNDEEVSDHIAFLHQNRDYLISIDKLEHSDYEDVTTIKVTFKFLKKRASK
jgi:hypothetical protein